MKLQSRHPCCPAWTLPSSQTQLQYRGEPPSVEELSKNAQRDLKTSLVQTRAANVQLEKQVRTLMTIKERSEATERRLLEEVERLKEEISLLVARERQNPAPKARCCFRPRWSRPLWYFRTLTKRPGQRQGSAGKQRLTAAPTSRSCLDAQVVTPVLAPPPDRSSTPPPPATSESMVSPPRAQPSAQASSPPVKPSFLRRGEGKGGAGASGAALGRPASRGPSSTGGPGSSINRQSSTGGAGARG